MRILLRRRELRLSQAAVAKRAEIDNTYVSKAERGAVPLSLQLLERLAAALESTVDFLLGQEAKQPPAELREEAEQYGSRQRPKGRRPATLKAVDPGTMVEIPVVSEVQAKGYDPCMGDLSEFLADVDGTVMECVPSARYAAMFAVCVRNVSLCPDYPPGSVLYVDGGQLPQRGDLVIACLEDEEEIVAKYYQRRQNVITLSSGNDHGETYEIDLAKEPHRLRWMFPVLEERVDLRERRRWQLKMRNGG